MKTAKQQVAAQFRVATSPNGAGLDRNRSDLRLHTTELGFSTSYISSQQVQKRSRKLTLCVLYLFGSVSCLAPFLTLHLTNRVGLLLFESELLQLRSSFLSVIICFIFLVILDLIIIQLQRFRRVEGTETQRQLHGSLLMQKILRQLGGFAALVSAVSYLSLALVVPQVRQLQRMPLATFDCSANQITIENCRQQFASKSDEQSIFETIGHLLGGDLNGNSERLIEKLGCLKYNHRSFGTSAPKTPTRFLLHKCGLVCRPERQPLQRQFGDDLNAVVNNGPSPGEPLHGELSSQQRQLAPPYDQNVASQAKFGGQSSDHVSVKLCFSGEISGGSNYKRYCIENLTSGRGSGGGVGSAALQQQQELTVGQLNAMLSGKFGARANEEVARELSGGGESAHRDVYVEQNKSSPRDAAGKQDGKGGGGRGGEFEFVGGASQIDKSASYLNSIVQFESHFKNWPHLARANAINNNNEASSYSLPIRNHQQVAHNYNVDGYGDDSTTYLQEESEWCKFKPMPPFIVNNKPFSDIECSLEHEYTISTATSLPMFASKQVNEDKIYLNKQERQEGLESGRSASSPQERCNIQCKVSVLYQVDLSVKHASDSSAPTSASNVYYLPLKPCLIVSGDGDKSRTSNYYLVCRTLADSSLLITFVLIDLMLLFESIDTKQFQLEAKKFRLISLLLTITLLPLVAALLFDLSAFWLPNYVNRSRRDGYLVAFINERLIPLLSEFFGQVQALLMTTQNTISATSINMTSEGGYLSPNQHAGKQIARADKQVLVDNYLVPFFVYSILMFALAINSFKLPLVASSEPLVRVASTEELGMARATPTTPTSTTQTRQEKNVSRNDLPNLVDSNSRRAAQGGNISRISKVIAAKQSSGEQLKRLAKRVENRRSLEVAVFAMVTLFMGLQFNLSQLASTEIFLETFGGNVKDQHKAAFLFALATQSSGTIFALVIATIFSDEISTFLAEFAPFRQTELVEDKLVKRQTESNFNKYLAISLLIYSLRHFVLANLSSQMSKAKWPLVFLYQITELFNFPLIWFVLTSRGHEMIARHPNIRKLQRVRGPQTTKALVVHLLVQSALVFVYFALARFVALFAHSLHTSLYLHSDNVDWFIQTFYADQQQQSRGDGGTDTPLYNATSQPPFEALFAPLPSERQTYLHSSRLFLKYNSLVCLLFGLVALLTFARFKYKLSVERERQLTRSKLIRRPISVTSDRESDLIDERISLDIMRIHANRVAQNTKPLVRTILPTRDTSISRDSDCEPTRARIHFHYNVERQRKPARRQREETSSAEETISSSCSTSESSTSTCAPKISATRGERPAERLRSDSIWRKKPEASNLIRPPKAFEEAGVRSQVTRRTIPIALAEEDERDSDVLGETLQANDVEKVTKFRSKRLFVVERDDEDGGLWRNLTRREANILDGSGDSQLDNEESGSDRSKQEPVDAADGDEQFGLNSPLPPQFADNYSAVQVGAGKRRLQSSPGGTLAALRNNSNRRITFAPTTTLIGHHNGARLHRFGRTSGQSAATGSSRQQTTLSSSAAAAAIARRASPELSIDGNDGATSDDESANNYERRKVGEADSID